MIQPLANLSSLLSSDIKAQFGGKAYGLFTARQLGLNIPDTWCLSTALHHEVEKNKTHSTFHTINFLSDKLENSLENLPDDLYAVRSSATIEDGQEKSFAGIFESKLNVLRQDIPQAIAEIFSALNAKRVKAYAHSAAIEMGIVIQKMVPVAISGVAFSKHPAPSDIRENAAALIEWHEGVGEALVQGEIKPISISGTFEKLYAGVNVSWFRELLLVLIRLEHHFQMGVDVEFAIDQRDKLYILQQRPVSARHLSHCLKLMNYKRAYKRSLDVLDIELLITGCVQYLPTYLESSIDLSAWMVMTSQDDVQSLWLEKNIDAMLCEELQQKIMQDKDFLTRLETQYRWRHKNLLALDHQQFLTWSSLSQAFQAWVFAMLPYFAHYYAPMFVIDALLVLLEKEMLQVDAQAAKQDLGELAFDQVRTLSDILQAELHGLKSQEKLSSAELQIKLEKLAHQFGFLNCRHLDAEPYSAKDLHGMLQAELPVPMAKSNAHLIKKYSIHNIPELLKALHIFLNIRNQEMEYLYDAFVKARPFFAKLAMQLQWSPAQVWASRQQTILSALDIGQALSFQTMKTPCIYHDGQQVQVKDQLNIIFPSVEKNNTALHGKVVYGQGKLKLKVKKVFSPQALDDFVVEVDQSYVLVTGMTTPDFVPYLRNVFSALITDEGGLLCHAAILARELGLPAIVGTGIATDQLIDGQIVEIDFDRAEIIMPDLEN